MLDLDQEKRTVSKHFNLPTERNEELKIIVKEMDTTAEHLLKCAITKFIRDYQADKTKAIKEMDTAYKRPHENCSTNGIIPEI
ncbi:MAG: hypothetical protein U9Q73_01845 [Nanoarchaeota archaeon]|nr:hypothetical protein [Nanoarchaeota archaeon]